MTDLPWFRRAACNLESRIDVISRALLRRRGSSLKFKMNYDNWKEQAEGPYNL
jgi:hypothetical protein